MTNYEHLFGTPEKVAEVVMAMNRCLIVRCKDCAARDICTPNSSFWDVPTMVAWLESEVER